MKTFTVNFSTKMGYIAKKSEKIKSIDIAGAKIIALKAINSDTYTISILDKSEKLAWHYGYTGVFIGTNKI